MANSLIAQVENFGQTRQGWYNNYTVAFATLSTIDGQAMTAKKINRSILQC